MSQKESGGLSAAAAILIVLGLIVAAALSFNIGQNAIRLITVTQTTTNVLTFTTTQVSISTVTVTITPPDYFQVNDLVLHSGTASSRVAQGTVHRHGTSFDNLHINVGDHRHPDLQQHDDGQSDNLSVFEFNVM